MRLGHAYVEHNEVQDLPSEASQRLGVVARRDRRQSGLLQRETDNFENMRIVVDDENAMGYLNRSKSVKPARARRVRAALAHC